MRPKVFLDIKTSRLNTYGDLPERVNLTAKSSKLDVKGPLKVLSVLVMIAYLLFGLAAAPNQSSFAAGPDPAQKALLQKQLEDLEAQIADDEATISAYQKQGTSLSSEIKSLNAKIAALNLKIKAVTISLDQLSREIKENTSQITITQDKLEFNRQAIADTLEIVYENERVSLVAVLLKNPNLSDFFNDINNLLDVQSSLSDTVTQINELKLQLLTEKEALAVKKNDAAQLKIFQDAQRKATQDTKLQKDQLLTLTKGNEQKYQQIVLAKKKTAAQIRNQIFQLLGGGEMTFEQAYEFAKYAEGATKVPASFLMAVLDRESRLGKNVGRCSYKTAMAPGKPKSTRDDVTPFLQITAELGLDPDTTLVSCANADGAYGGAMGPAQFIPTTWMLYRNRIASITGVNPPSPWKNSDAFLGTALYLKDAMSACTGPTYGSGNGQIKCAAARYYAGGGWSKFISSYGSATLTRKQQFDDDIAVLNDG